MTGTFDCHKLNPGMIAALPERLVTFWDIWDLVSFPGSGIAPRCLTPVLVSWARLDKRFHGYRTGPRDAAANFFSRLVTKQHTASRQMQLSSTPKEFARVSLSISPPLHHSDHGASFPTAFSVFRLTLTRGGRYLGRESGSTARVAPSILLHH